jgi:hypothetical protein
MPSASASHPWMNTTRILKASLTDGRFGVKPEMEIYNIDDPGVKLMKRAASEAL